MILNTGAILLLHDEGEIVVAMETVSVTDQPRDTQVLQIVLPDPLSNCRNNYHACDCAMPHRLNTYNPPIHHNRILTIRTPIAHSSGHLIIRTYHYSGHLIIQNISFFRTPPYKGRKPQYLGHLIIQDTSLFRTPHYSGHLILQDTSFFRTPHYSGHLIPGHFIIQDTFHGDVPD